MKGFLEALYQYAQEERIGRYLESREYYRAVCDLEENWTAFRSGLTAEQGERLDALLGQERQVGYLTEEAAFCSALSIGVGLGRL